MNSIFAYLLELNITLSFLYLIYIIIFKKDSNFNLRRIYLLVSMFIAGIFPLLHIHFPQNGEGIGISMIQIEEVFATQDYLSTTTNLQHYSTSQIFGIIYLLISCAFLLRLIVLISGIILKTKKAEKRTIFEQKIHVSEKLHASSFFNIIFIDPDQSKNEQLKHIVEHELHHARLFHSIDRIISELILSLSWLNPIIWMFKKSMIVNHEYQADNRVIEQGTDQVSYQISILNQYIGSATISNQFSNQIKKRIKMLNKSYKKGSFWKGMLLLPVSAMLFMFVACDKDGEPAKEKADQVESEIVKVTENKADAENVKKTAEEEIFYVVENMPKWKGSDEDISIMIRKHIASNLKYPSEAAANGVQGRVYIKFVINKEGKVVVPDPSTLAPEKSDSGNIDEVVVITYRPVNMGDKTPDKKYVQLLKDEAKRVIYTLPDMEPGTQRGKKVTVMYTMPINFVLN